MVMFREGSNHPAGTPVAKVTRFTPGKYVPLNKAPLIGTGVAPCSVKGEKCQFIFNDTIDPATSEFGVGLISPLSGGDAARALAGGVVADGEDLIVVISGVDGLPKFASAELAGDVGDYIVANARLGNAATGEDIANADGVFFPSLTVFLYAEPQRVAAAEDIS